MDTKKWYTSKTLWANIVAVGAGIAAQMTATHTPGVDINGPNGMLALGVLNAILRWATDKKIVA